MAIIYHITSIAEWEQAKAFGSYTAASLKTEGFIHCSEERQVAAVLERYFKNKTALIKLVIDTDKLNSPLQFDWSPSIKDSFPHIYGPINLDAVQSTIII